MKTQSFIFGAAAIFLAAGCETVDPEPVAEERHLGLREEYDLADRDGNGTLSHREVAEYHHERELELYDLDNDRHISKAEWTVAHASPADDLEHFNQFDKDDDGQVSTDEAITFVTQHVSFGDMMKEFDENGDSNLHWQEIEAGMPTEARVTMFSFHPGNS